MIAGGDPGGLALASRRAEERRRAEEAQRREEEFIANQTLFCLHQPVRQSGDTTEEWELCVKGAPIDIRATNKAELTFVTRTVTQTRDGFVLENKEEVKREAKSADLSTLERLDGNVLTGIFRYYGISYDEMLREERSNEGAILKGIAAMEDWIRGRKKVERSGNTPEHQARNVLADLMGDAGPGSVDVTKEGGTLLFDYLTSGEGRGIDHPYAPLKGRALLALARIDPVRAAPIVEAKDPWKSGEEPLTNREGIEALGLLKTEWAYQRLLQLLEDQKFSNRYGAIKALKNFSIDQRIAALTGKPEIGVWDSDVLVREDACGALNQGNKSVPELVKPGQCAKDPNDYPRQRAIATLGEIGTLEAVDALLHLEPKDRPDLRNIEEAIDKADPDGSKRRALEGPAWTGCSTTGIGGL